MSDIHPYIYDVIPWKFKIPSKALERLIFIINDGWELIAIANGLAYFRKPSPEYLRFLEIEQRKSLVAKKRIK